jgi:hypothetical protein
MEKEKYMCLRSRLGINSSCYYSVLSQSHGLDHPEEGGKVHCVGKDYLGRRQDMPHTWYSHKVRCEYHGVQRNGSVNSGTISKVSKLLILCLLKCLSRKAGQSYHILSRARTQLLSFSLS